MMIEVQVFSKVIIKPSSPTPDHLRRYQLSFLDQLTSKVYNPFIFFYALNNDQSSDITAMSDKIKRSLSEALALFYPLAGRVKGDRFVDCDDEGIPYLEAQVKAPSRLQDVLRNPVPSELNKLLPMELDGVDETPLGVQLNIFGEGSGIAVGLCVSHHIADALSCLNFIKTWASISRGDNGDGIARPEFVSSVLFPPRDDLSYDPNAKITRENTMLAKRFVFEASAIEAIRSKLFEEEEEEDDHRHRDRLQIKQPESSRVEALSAFLWSRLIAATLDSEPPATAAERVYAMFQPVNIRRKLDPPLPDHSFGNLYRCSLSTITASSSSSGGRYHDFARRIRDGVKKVDGDYVKKVQQGEDVHLELYKEEAAKLKTRGGEVVPFGFTSLCRFPLYDADFGWGEPAWVSSAALTFNNLVVLMDAKTGKGIEAYVSLKMEHMARLEADEEFLKYTVM